MQAHGFRESETQTRRGWLRDRVRDVAVVGASGLTFGGTTRGAFADMICPKGLAGRSTTGLFYYYCALCRTGQLWGGLTSPRMLTLGCPTGTMSNPDCFTFGFFGGGGGGPGGPGGGLPAPSKQMPSPQTVTAATINGIQSFESTYATGQILHDGLLALSAPDVPTSESGSTVLRDALVRVRLSTGAFIGLQLMSASHPEGGWNLVWNFGQQVNACDPSWPMASSFNLLYNKVYRVAFGSKAYDVVLAR